MTLYIIRHAVAGQRGDPNYPDDSLRPLTKKGRRRFSRMIKRLAKRGFAPQVVATSPLVRCKQTAEALVERLASSTPIVELRELEPGSDLQAVVAWTKQQGVVDVAWVGHAPDVDRMLEALLGQENGCIEMAKGAVAALEFEHEVGLGQGGLSWLVTPAILGR
jgi:phosphohistidine phosphatase